MAETQKPAVAADGRRWHLLDASAQILGRLASRAVYYLRGKHRPDFSPHKDGGDYVVVINAAKVRVTGRKPQQKVYFRHSGYPAGARFRTLEEMTQRRPEEVIRLAIHGMLPPNRLRKRMLRRLKVFAGPGHPYPPDLFRT